MQPTLGYNHPPMAGRFLRDNAFLGAAVALPVLVIGVFLLLTAIPKWSVPPPRHDLLLYTSDYDRSSPGVIVDLFVRDGTLQARFTQSPKDYYPPRVRLWRFDHSTLGAREVPIDVPSSITNSDPGTPIVVDALRGQRIVTDTKAPDGYEVRTPDHGSPGVIGDLFGMRRYDRSLAIVNRGRVVPIEIPTVNRYSTPVFLGWLIEEGAR